MKVRRYRSSLSGLGSARGKVDKSKIRVLKSHFRADKHGNTVEGRLTYDQFIADFKSQGGMAEEAIDLLTTEQVFETETAFYTVESGLGREGIKAIFLELINEHLDKCDSAATPNVCEMASTGREQLALAVYDIVYRERIGIGAAIVALEGQLE